MNVNDLLGLFWFTCSKLCANLKLL